MNIFLLYCQLLHGKIVMGELIEFEDELLYEENKDMPSKKHSQAQTNLTILLGKENRFTTFVELSLDATSIDLSQFGLKAKDELIPDICIYIDEPPPERDDDELDNDEMRVKEIPDLAIEVLLPKQSISDLLSKIKAYFLLGVKSCWLVMPSIRVIKLYSQTGSQIIAKTFGMENGEVFDERLNIRLPIEKVFRRLAV
jgi:Uma2 family endonuclease